jgi:cyclopropane-fatty-acyl-phospholipid synthase
MTSTLNRPDAQITIGEAMTRLMPDGVPFRFSAYDGSTAGPTDSPIHVHLRNQRGLSYLLTAPGDLGMARAYVSGDLTVEGVHPGDPYEALLLLQHEVGMKIPPPAEAFQIVRGLGWSYLKPPPPPPQEALPKWRRLLEGFRHSKGRDADAIHHHYDVSNRFYELVLGPSMTYSCAVWSGADDDTLESAQAAKYELICRKLDLRDGMRLLDVGCGWGGMAMHAARHHGVRSVGVTLSRRQFEYAQKAVAEAGLADRVEVRLQDYRAVRDGPFDAISSIGMFEHVGLRNLSVYFRRLHDLLVPRGRLLNHGISRPARVIAQPGRRRPRTPSRLGRRSFVGRYVFPDGELHEVGAVISAMQGAGFETRHDENLREHYGLTLRAWVENLERSWDEAVAEVGPERARIWRLYMAASALNFEAGSIQVHQVLGIRPRRGDSGMPLRPGF